MMALFQRNLRETVVELRTCGQALSRPEVWDGQNASAFRSQLWPSASAGIDRLIVQLDRLSGTADRVVRDVMTAGTDGALDHVGAGTGLAMLSEQQSPDANVKDALAYFRANIDTTTPQGDRATLEAIDQRLMALTPAERAAFLAQLSPAELQDWNARLAPNEYALPREGIIANGLSSDDRTQLANLLFGSADPGSLETLSQTMTNLQPPLQDVSGDGYGNLTWRSTQDMPLYGPYGPSVSSDINQGDLGDCYFLAALGSVTQTDPKFIQNHIQQNPNGSYTVTFYRNGQPVPVTVTGDLPYSAKTNSYPYANPGSQTDPETGATTDAKWAAIYEKAYAQFRGGYDVAGQGVAGFRIVDDSALADITGNQTQDSDLHPFFSSGPTISDIQSQLNNGYAITAQTNKVQTWPWQQEPTYEDSTAVGKQIVTEHQYMVLSTNPNGSPPTITLQNPWGQGSAAPETVVLTQDQFDEYFASTTAVKVP
jgi:hypothetical protein